MPPKDDTGYIPPPAPRSDGADGETLDQLLAQLRQSVQEDARREAAHPKPKARNEPPRVAGPSGTVEDVRYQTWQQSRR